VTFTGSFDIITWNDFLKSCAVLCWMIA